MRLSIALQHRFTALLLALAAALLAPGAHCARAADADMLAAEPLAAVTGAERTAIDPLRLTREMRVSNRYLGIIDGSYRNTLEGELRLATDDAWLFRAVVPFVMTDQFGDHTTTGDLRLGLDAVRGLSARGGWLLGLDAIFDTSAEIPGGRGKHSLEPHLLWALYRAERTVIAPYYRHTLSVAGESWRPDINEATVGLMIGWTSVDGKFWSVVTPEAVLDLEGKTQFFSVSLELGCEAADNSRLYIKPMAGVSSEDYPTIGVDYPFDWGVEIGWRLTFE